MDRVDTSTTIAVAPALEPVGTPGFFTKGNPGGGIPATSPGQDWCNAIQEEVIAVILDAGLTLDKADNGQVLAALKLGIQQPAFFARLSADTGGFLSNTFVKVIADTEVFDFKGHYDNATGLFTCVTPGLYTFTGTFKINSSLPDQTQMTCELWLNGAAYLRGTHPHVSGLGGTIAAMVTGQVDLAVDDTVELRGWQSSPGTATAQATNTWFAGHRHGRGA